MNIVRFLVAIIPALLVIACSNDPASPEEQVRQFIAQAETAAEERDSAALRGLVADDYLDAQGNDKKNIDNLIRFYLLRHQKIYLLTTVKEITLPAPGRADVTLAVAMAGAPFPDDIASLQRLRADAMRFELTMAQQDHNDWRVISARWTRANLQDFL